MHKSLAITSLCCGLAASRLTADNATEHTIVPLRPVIAISESGIELPPAPTEAPSGSVRENGNTGSETLGTPSPRVALSQDALETPSPGSITLVIYGSIKTTSASISAPPIVYPSQQGKSSAQNTVESGRIVHTEETQESLHIPTSYPPPTFLPSPVALTSYVSLAHPTLPATTEHASAPANYPSVVEVTVPVSVSDGQHPPSYTPLIVHTEIPGESLLVPSSETTTATPAGIVRTEVSAESLLVPPGQTYATPRPETVVPAVPVPGGDGEGPSSVPPTTTSVSSTPVTMAPSTVSSSTTNTSVSSSVEPDTTAPPLEDGGSDSDGESGSGSGDFEGTAAKARLMSWIWPLFGAAIGSVVFM